jgi:hypothetical protein
MAVVGARPQLAVAGTKMLATMPKLRVLAIACSVIVGLHSYPGFTQTPSTGESSHFDGPAELPRTYVLTSLLDTPAPGRTQLVRPTDDVEKALARANCGETIALQAGATFRGVIHFPAKSCDDSHWIIVRTSASNDDLPPEDTRISPCFAGVATLPGRPDFHCKALQNVMARIEYDGSQDSGPLLFSSGANHYRLIGLEITRSDTGAKLRNLAEVQDGAANHIVFDRVWMHGNSKDETKAGVHLSDMTYAAVINSFFSDFHCIAVAGACTDAQAVNGGTGNNPGGPYKIVNNFLEASGENLMFGGGAGTTTPADIEIRRNHLFKPLLWKPGEPGFVASAAGQPFIVKNHFELKNAQRVLFEGNLLENSWGGFSQTGFSILLTPKNQNNLCPLCRVTDITIRYNRIAHVASVLQIANGRSDAGGEATAGERYSIHDLVVDDIDGAKYKGFGSFAVIGLEKPLLRDINIQHVTAFPQRALFALRVAASGPKVAHVTIVNNLFSAGERQMASTGGGARNCSFRADAQGPAGVFGSCFTDSLFTSNIIIGGHGAWPKGNLLLRSNAAAGIVNFNNGHGGNYRLCRQPGETPNCKRISPGIHAGTDGRNIGADLDAIEAAIAGETQDGKSPLSTHAH